MTNPVRSHPCDECPSTPERCSAAISSANISTGPSTSSAGATALIGSPATGDPGAFHSARYAFSWADDTA